LFNVQRHVFHSGREHVQQHGNEFLPPNEKKKYGEFSRNEANIPFCS